MVINNDPAYLVDFTHPGPVDPRGQADTTEQRRSSIQRAELLYEEGRLTCDRDAPTYVQWSDPTGG